jgi:rod shape-determining protein MreD
MINGFQLLLLLLTAGVLVFLAAAVRLPWVEPWARLDLLPVLMVYAAVKTDLLMIGLTALVGGVAHDALSAAPLGVSVPALLAVGLALHRWRELLLQQLSYAQIVLGAFAGVAAPVLTLVLVYFLGEQPLAGWNLLLSLPLGAAVAALGAPVVFKVLDGLLGLFAYEPATPDGFRADRQIKRGRL